MAAGSGRPAGPGSGAGRLSRNARDGGPRGIPAQALPFSPRFRLLTDGTIFNQPANTSGFLFFTLETASEGEFGLLNAMEIWGSRRTRNFKGNPEEGLWETSRQALREWIELCTALVSREDA